MCTFTSLMNFPPPISVVTFTKINYLLFNSCSKTASKSTLYVATDTYERYTVSGDDIWSKTEHLSINWLVTLISKKNGKCIDSYVVSKKCKGCSLWANEKNSPGYQEWLTNHVCQVNLSRSSGSMEPTGIANMFKRY